MSFVTSQKTMERVKTAPAIKATPVSWGPSWAIPPPRRSPGLATAAAGQTVGSAKRPSAMVPNTPLARWTAVAPTRVVDPDPVEEKDRRDHQDAGEDADDEGTGDAHEGAGSGDRHQAREAAVQGHPEVGFPEEDPGRDHGGEGRRRSGHVGGGGHVRDGGAVRGHRGAGVEPEPSEPEDEHADGGRGHAVAGDGVHLDARAVFAAPGSPPDDSG